MTELSKRFNFKEVEDKWIKYWEGNNLFHAQPNPKKKPYCIVIPPPNVTGILHMGHALNNTLQDIIVRYKRMQGFEACWMPGTDHAGIATQNVVERELSKDKKTRHDIGRDAFVEKLWDWKKEYGNTILHQLRKLGASCDWPRTSFTMDDQYSKAVKLVFVKLYEKNLIYRGEYIINWCPRCHTALSDEEAEHRETEGHLYYFRYPTKDDPKNTVVIATTRPETMLGDTAVAINPKDKRYKNLKGKTLILPLMNREIPIIEDDFVNPKFGTGAVKVTPAHDPNDFDMGQRHKLEFINVMNQDASINEKGGDFSGMDRFEAREAIIESLKELDLVEKIEVHTHAVGHCYRCHTVVEPYLSKQWFVKMKPLARDALKVVQKGKVKFTPQRWTKVYTNWMENIRDWCISRQIWWGHRIPVWYCIGDDKCRLECKEPIVSLETPQECPHCGSKNLQQDEDVLDTWFSSWLWPFATFGWPDENEDLKYFYPGHALFTASEIIFFWVARMIMAGIEFMGDIPFSDVYIHGTVRDAKGRKMSKSLGNALDPLEIIDEYGADALRFSLIINSGQDILISKEKFEIGRNFANKMWNATRLILMNAKKEILNIDLKEAIENDLPSQWIVSHYYSTLEKVNQSIESYRYSEAESLIYDFFWGNFCDWYLEIIKDRWSEENIQGIAFHILELSLKLIHPFMPFVTEEIWSQIHEGEDALCVQPWPATEKKLIDRSVEAKMQTMINVVTSIRNIRNEFNIKPKDILTCSLASSKEQERELLSENKAFVEKMSKVRIGSVGKQISQEKNAASGIVGHIKFSLLLGDIIDLEKEKTRIKTQIESQKKAVDGLSRRLNNKDFLKKAPKDIVEKDTKRLEHMQSHLQKLEQVISDLN